MRNVLGAAVISLFLGGLAHSKLPADERMTDWSGDCPTEVTEYFYDFTGEKVDLATLDGEWEVIDVDDYVDLRVPGEPTFYNIFIAPVPNTDGETPMVWYGNEGPYYFEELDEMFSEHQLP